ncbi:M20/M25/M40 family metallo-hydrolase [Aminobacter anthyllidis]|uniref:M20/M25/M40 family metallo-hydrolase n=1 Tax=Aminobacter anthyllidis TaxID=1035067 RepID=UPI0024554DAB|nr:M20/M25/M40 family metallo-hydrolase [Aminobacter anthyllidis]MDH4987490.1 M20/M25/M40 family metallo-hydrolase [Aminobacter anthyllidis]
MTPTPSCLRSPRAGWISFANDTPPYREIEMTDPNRKRILDKVDASKDEAVRFLQKMVTIPSVTGDEAAIQAFLHGYLNTIGLDVDIWDTDWEELKKHPGYRPVARGYEGRPNIVANAKGSGGGRSLLLNGHTDVIPVGNGEGWSDNPWSAKIENGRIYGRGSCDMKSGVASHILAVQYLKELGIDLKGDVLINIVIDEEVSGHGTLDTVIRGYSADAGISGETSDLHVQPACIGRIWFEIEIQGKPAGIQQRYLGVSGIMLGQKIVAAVQEMEDERVATVKHPLYPSAIDSLPCIIGSFQAGNYPSAFPATALLKGSIGTVPGEDHEGVKQSLVKKIAEAAAKDPWMKDHPLWCVSSATMPRPPRSRVTMPSCKPFPATIRKSPARSRPSADARVLPIPASSTAMVIPPR